jgi:hypothetical protein
MAATPAERALAYFEARRDKWETLCAYLNGERKPVSLRQIDEFMRHHADRLHVAHGHQTGQPDLLGNDFRQVLSDTGGKAKCDLFNRRGQGHDITLHNQTLFTSDAQLVFFHWALQHDLVDRVAKILPELPPSAPQEETKPGKRADDSSNVPAQRRQRRRVERIPVASATGVPDDE